MTTGESEESTSAGIKLPRVSRQALLAAAGTLLVCLLLAAVSFEPFVRKQVERRASARGFDVQVDEVDLGWGGLWLKDVAASAPAMPALKAKLDAVFVPFGSSAIEVHGGDVMLTGSYDDVSQQWSRLRKPSSAAAPSTATGNDYLVDGLRLRWTKLGPGADEQRAWGFGFRRSAGDESVSADLVRVFAAGAALELRGAEAKFRRQQSGRTLLAAKGSSALLDVDVSTLLSARAERGEPKGQPTAAPGGTAGGSSLPLLLAALSSAARSALAENAKLELPAVRARLRAASDVLNFGPSRLVVERKEGALHALLEPGSAAADTTPLALKLTLPLAGGEPQLELDGGPVSLAALGVGEGDFGLFDVRRASIEVHTKLALVAGPSLRVNGSGNLRDVSLLRPALSPSPLKGIRVGWRLGAESRLDGTRLDVTDAELTVGDVRLTGSGLLERNGDYYRIKAQGGIPLGACEKLLDSVPQGFAPLLGDLRMSGTFSTAFAMDVDTHKLDRMKVELDVKNACVITHVPESLAPSRFQGPWVRTVKGVGGEPMTIESGPGSAGWVSYDGISKYMETAVVVCEDGGFFRHDGIDYNAIEKSIQDNVRAGRFLRGGSTISMQLAKNLYLGKEKTLSRKFEEAILTRLLEQQFQKKELMELYLNVIEFGPGIYGIGPAARHYFNVEPEQLTLGQSLYLASILPSPDSQHFREDGAVSERWMKYLHKLMWIARKISRITEEELEAGLAEQVAFRVPGAEPPAFSDEPPPPEPDAEPSGEGR